MFAVFPKIFIKKAKKLAEVRCRSLSAQVVTRLAQALNDKNAGRHKPKLWHPFVGDVSQLLRNRLQGLNCFMRIESDDKITVVLCR
jgi:hypothetical protein